MAYFDQYLSIRAAGLLKNELLLLLESSSPVGKGEKKGSMVKAPLPMKVAVTKSLLSISVQYFTHLCVYWWPDHYKLCMAIIHFYPKQWIGLLASNWIIKSFWSSFLRVKEWKFGCFKFLKWLLDWLERGFDHLKVMNWWSVNLASAEVIMHLPSMNKNMLFCHCCLFDMFWMVSICIDSPWTHLYFKK